MHLRRYFDTYGHAVVPFQGGLALSDINADETQTEGYFHRQSMMAEDILIKAHMFT